MAEEENASMSLWEHVNELRKRLFIGLIAFIVACVATFNLAPIFIGILSTPVGGMEKLVSIEVTENLGVFLRVSLLAGFILSLPLLLYELMAFIAPGLTSSERKWVYLFIPFATIMFVAGVAFTYFVMLPAAIPFLIDFLGINYYSRNVVGAQGNLDPVPGSQYTDMGWEICAPALRRLLNRLHRDYRLPPIYITENGAAFADAVGPDGKVHDPHRLDYLKQHFIQTRLAMQDGVDVRGYFPWSLTDNFEWAYGFSKRFGLVRVDYETQERTLKESGEWYTQLIESNKLEAE